MQSPQYSPGKRYSVKLRRADGSLVAGPWTVTRYEFDGKRLQGWVAGDLVIDICFALGSDMVLVVEGTQS